MEPLEELNETLLALYNEHKQLSQYCLQVMAHQPNDSCAFALFSKLCTLSNTWVQEFEAALKDLELRFKK